MSLNSGSENFLWAWNQAEPEPDTSLTKRFTCFWLARASLSAIARHFYFIFYFLKKLKISSSTFVKLALVMLKVKPYISLCFYNQSRVCKNEESSQPVIFPWISLEDFSDGYFLFMAVQFEYQTSQIFCLFFFTALPHCSSGCFL